MMDKYDLIQFEKKIAIRFDNGEIPYLVHFSGGNEDQLIEIFSKNIKSGDYIFSTHRSHYHYLLAGGSPQRLEDLIMSGRSMFVFDRKLNFYTSSIVAATPSIAAGVAWAIKRKGEKDRIVWCFVGDGAEDEGHFCEAVRYVEGWELPCRFIIEDNDRSVCAGKKERWGPQSEIEWSDDYVHRYKYMPTYPHGGSGSSGWLTFTKEAELFPPLERIPLKQLKDFPILLSYKEAVKASMERLARDFGAIFIGYNVRHGSAYGTLSDIPEEQRLETPVAENLMAGLAMGMSLEGFRPVVFFERHDFVHNALDALVHQLDRIETLSQGEFKMPVIIRAVAGSVKPFYAGPTHTSDYTDFFRQTFHFPVYAPKTPAEVIEVYEAAMKADHPVMISELKELY